jgi:hypothetical protein
VCSLFKDVVSTSDSTAAHVGHLFLSRHARITYIKFKILEHLFLNNVTYCVKHKIILKWKDDNFDTSVSLNTLSNCSGF